MKINHYYKTPIAPAIGVLLLFVLTACQSPKTPEDTAMAFWSALAKNNLSQAKKFCSTHSQDLLAASPQENLQNARFNFGEIVINADNATVKMQMTQTKGATTPFMTFLVKQDNHWKVDCRRSLQQFSAGNFVNDLFKNLDKLGQQLNKQLQQQIPLIEKEIESFGQELKQQINEFGNNLKKPSPQKKPTNPYQQTI